MAKHCLFDVVVSANGSDLSDHVISVAYELTIEPQPAGAMGNAQKYSMPGAQVISPIVVTFHQDFAAAETWATHKALYTARSTFSLIVKPTSAADSATNPAFTIDVFIGSMQVISGAHGDGHQSQITYEPAGLLTIDET